MLYDDHEWVRRYRPASPTPWQGRHDGEGARRFHEVFVCDDLRQPLEVADSGPTFGLLGFACDEGVRRNHGRVGAAEGPLYFREALAKLPVNMEGGFRFYDVGDITCDDGDLEGAQLYLGKTVASLLEQGITPLVIGGGHEVAWGQYQGLATALKDKDLSIVNFDAHFDLRPMQDERHGSSGSPFMQIASSLEGEERKMHYTVFGLQALSNTMQLFRTAEHFKVDYVLAEEMESGEAMKAVERILASNRPIFLTLCLDVFSAAFAPGVSAPQPLGIAPWQLLKPLSRLMRSGKVLSVSIAELAPRYDRDFQTCGLAANLLSRMVHEWGTRHLPEPLLCC